MWIDKFTKQNYFGTKQITPSYRILITFNLTTVLEKEESRDMTKCYKCGNEYGLPSRSAVVLGGADFEYCYCKECHAFLGSVRIDLRILPGHEGFGWVGGIPPTHE